MDIIFNNLNMIGKMFFICALAWGLNYWRLCLQFDGKNAILQRILLVLSIILAVFSIFVSLITVAIAYFYHGLMKQKYNQESIEISNINHRRYNDLVVDPLRKKITALEAENQSLKELLYSQQHSITKET